MPERDELVRKAAEALHAAVCGCGGDYHDGHLDRARAVLDAVAGDIRAEALDEACKAIEKRRCARRRRWLRSNRWSAEQESLWSQGMWDAGRVVRSLVSADRIAGGQP